MIGSNLFLGEKTVRVAEGDAPNSFGKLGGNQWAALCAAHNSVSEKPLSSVLVPERGLEPPRACAHQLLGLTRLPISPLRRHLTIRLEGLEPSTVSLRGICSTIELWALNKIFSFC